MYKLNMFFFCAFHPSMEAGKSNNLVCAKDKWLAGALCEWPSFRGCRWINKTWLGIDVVPRTRLESQKRTKSPFNPFNVLAQDLEVQ